MSGKLQVCGTARGQKLNNWNGIKTSLIKPLLICVNPKHLELPVQRNLCLHLHETGAAAKSGNLFTLRVNGLAVLTRKWRSGQLYESRHIGAVARRKAAGLLYLVPPCHSTQITEYVRVLGRFQLSCVLEPWIGVFFLWKATPRKKWSCRV